MGLDMFLNKMPRIAGIRRENVTAVDMVKLWLKYRERENYDPDIPKYTLQEYVGEDVVKNIPGGKELVKLLDYKPGLIQEVGYWRKVNWLHNWFVNNVQNGIDDCQYHNEVTKEDLKELLRLCKTVAADHSEAPSLLPPCNGFFFGSSVCDEYYFESIDDVIEDLEKILKETDFDTEMLFYCSSW